MKILTVLDMLKNQIKNLVLENKSSAPSNPVAGQVYFDTSTNKMKIYDGSAWVEACGGGGGIAKYTEVLDEDPANSVTGQICSEYAADEVVFTENIQLSSNKMYYGVAFGNGKFVAVGNGGYIAYSTDGITWDENTHLSRIYYGVAFGNGKFVAAGSNGYIAYSTDGINWVEDSLGGPYTRVAFGNGKFVAIGNNGYTAYSFDGANWVENTPLSSGRTYTRVAFGNGKFVAIGASGASSYTMYSTDGINWVENTPISSPGTYNGVTFGNGKFVAVGTDGYTAYSFDGVNWVISPSLGNNIYQGITFGGGKFVAVGNNGYTAYSTDGITWVINPSLGNRTYAGVAFGNGKFVAVGASGYTAYSNSNTKLKYFNGVGWVFYLNESELEKYIPIACALSNPSRTNKVLTQNEMGALKYNGSGQDTTIEVGSLKRMFNAGSANSLTLGEPRDPARSTNQYYLIVSVGYSGFSLTITPPSGYTLKWVNGVPTFTVGKTYEISFLNVLNSTIVAVWTEYDS